jgi:Rrf2 family protein
MRLTAKADYAVRAAVELAARPDRHLKVEEIAEAQSIPPRFLENILLSLRRAGLAQSRRGADGGYRLARPAEEITVADVLRAVEGPLANIQGIPPEELHPEGSAAALRDVWVAVRASLRRVLEAVTLADIASGRLPDDVAALTADPAAWRVR